MQKLGCLVCVVALAVGCTSENSGAEAGALSTLNDPARPDDCPVVCSAYDPSVCEPVCPEPPRDASPPADPYGEPTVAPDAGPPPSPTPDPFVLAPTGRGAGGHRAG